MLSKRVAKPQKNRCVSCGACRKECPRSAIQIWRGCYAVVDPQLCVGCVNCANIFRADCILLV